MHHIKAQQGDDWSVGITVQGNGFTPSFVASFLMILACEIGDKTFFIAAIMRCEFATATATARRAPVNCGCRYLC